MARIILLCCLATALALAEALSPASILYPGLKDELIDQPVEHIALFHPSKQLKEELLDQPVQFMASLKTPHEKQGLSRPDEGDILSGERQEWPNYDFSKFDEYLEEAGRDTNHNRIKRRAKRRRNRRRGKGSTEAPEVEPSGEHLPHPVVNATETTVPPVPKVESRRTKKRKGKSSRPRSGFSSGSGYDSDKGQNRDTGYEEVPKDLYQAHLRPGVIFRIHMAEAILKMQYRNYAEDKDESVIEADVEYLRLTRKVISDEITKFDDLRWLTEWFTNRSDLIQEHTCNTKYFTVGIPPTMFTHSEEYMKRMCLFDNVYIDHIPYVIGEDSSLMAAVAPPVLHCDAATCTSVPFIDSLMFCPKLPMTNVRTITRCQASCRQHCRNAPDCLQRCVARCGH